MAVATTVELDEPTPVELEGEPRAPLTASIAGETVGSLGIGDTQTTVTYELTFRIAGTHSLGPVAVALHDPDGLFEVTVERGDGPEVTVDTRVVRGMHIGRGGQTMAESFEGHRGREAYKGIEPQEVREYVPGDLVRHIDWNATARHDELYIRQFETNRDA